MKKLLSCLLAFVMLLSLSAAALASDYSDVSKYPQEAYRLGKSL